MGLLSVPADLGHTVFPFSPRLALAAAEEPHDVVAARGKLRGGLLTWGHGGTCRRRAASDSQLRLHLGSFLFGAVDAASSNSGAPIPALELRQDGAPMVLKAIRPEGLKAWDGNASDKDFLAFPKTTGAEIRIVLAMLFGAKAESVSVPALGSLEAAIGEKFQHGDRVAFEVAGGKAMTLVVMSPLELGEKLTDLEIKDDWTVGQVRKLLCSITGLKEGSMLMAKGKMGERVSEDAQLKLSDLVVDYGYKDGDEIGFIYMGDPEADLKAFLKK